VQELGQRLARAGAPRAPDDWHALMDGAFTAVTRDFHQTTERLGTPGDFAATLTVAVLAPPWLATASLGDGVVIVGAESDGGETRLHLITHAPPAGEYVNETRFLTSADALRHVAIRCVQDSDLTAVLLGTDGVVPIGVQRGDGTERPNESFVEPVLASLGGARSDPAEVTRLLLDKRISQQSQDDKTILAAVRT
jgi:hypothetical protein